MAKLQLNPMKKIQQLLAHTPIPVALAGTLDETELFSYDVAGGLLGKNGALRIELVFSNYVLTNNKKVKVTFGSTILAEFTVTTNPSTKVIITLTNRNNEASQICFVEVEAGGTVTLTGTTILDVEEDTTATKTLSVTATTTLESAIAVGGDSLTSDVANEGVDVIAHFPNHAYNFGDYVLIAGANETAYNGTWEIFGMSQNYFHYNMDAVASGSPATGTITAQRYSRITLEYCDIELLR